MSKLSQFRAAESSPPKALWRPPQFDDLLQAVVVSFDQTIRNTGWVLLDVFDSKATIQDSGTLKTKAGEQKGWASTLDSAKEMYHQMDSLLSGTSGHEIYADLLAYEAPAAFGHRTESSALAAFSLKLLGNHTTTWGTHMVPAQKMKKYITGNGNANKHDIGKALSDLDWVVGFDKLKNEHERDALGLGITALHLRRDNA